MDPNKINAPQNPADPNEVKPLDYQQDIHNVPMEDLVAQQHKQEADWADEWNNPPQEEKKTETSEPPSSPTTQSTTPSAQTPANVEENKSEPAQAAPKQATPQTPVINTDEIAEKVTEKVVANLNPTTPEEKKNLEQKLADLQEKAKAEGREITYTEALAFLKEETKAELAGELTETITKQVRENLDKEIAAEEQQKAEAKRVEEEKTKKNNEVMVTEWNRQVKVLQDEQGFPNPTDPAFQKAKDVLFQALKNRADKATKAGQPVSVSLIEAFHSPEYKALTQQEGKDAPVYGARKAVGNEPGGLKYTDIHNVSMEDILKEHYEKQGWA